MIASLADAWRWYETTRLMARTLERLGAKHWHNLPWEGDLGRDDHLRQLTSAEILSGSQTVLAEVEVELPPLRHVAIKHALEEMKEAIEHGSFFKVLEPYKNIDANLLEQVNQVRRYGNWVAHGRRTEQPAAVNPAAAYDRLRRFLDHLGA